MELTDEQQKEIGRLVAEGFTSGKFEEEDGTNVAWELKTNVWKD